MIANKLIAVATLAKNHFMKPDEVLNYVKLHTARFDVQTIDGVPHVGTIMGGLVLMAAKDSGLKRHPELYGLKLSDDGSHYVRA